MLAQDDTPLQPGDSLDLPAGGALPLMAAAELQDDLMVANNDLERLQRLLGETCQDMIGHFYGASAELKKLLHRVAAHPEVDASELHAAMEYMAGAITTMQFGDMASQLVEHTTRRLRRCVDRLARETMGDDEDGPAVHEAEPQRPNPVTQDEMDAGSIELF